MQASRLFISTLATAGIVGFAGLAMAQTSPGTVPETNNATGQRSSTDMQTGTPGINETAAQRMERERLERERTGSDRMGADRTNAERMNDATNPNRMNPSDSTLGNSQRRDSNGNLIARADRN